MRRSKRKGRLSDCPKILCSLAESSARRLNEDAIDKRSSRARLVYIRRCKFELDESDNSVGNVRGFFLALISSYVLPVDISHLRAHHTFNNG